ncbi:MAG: carboxypeptidase regulatory-like domain-containing protein [Fuerstiella sp.]
MLSRLASVGLLCACVFLALPGCGGAASDMPDIGQVTGKVTIDGQPGANLMVTFQPQSGRPSYATTDEAGAYELTYNGDAKGAKLGSNLVTISTAGGGEDYGDGGSAKEVSLENADALPAKYNTLAGANEEMTVEVKSGANEFNWDIQSKE